ncbi:3-isopropylmalate dehydratase small subunit [Peptoniphilus equinus]|uniref:3-isopropylmalate dehydratase small subunit n=1 Tax=Peptoniphilus equinus TaxID=3016343 RepID=A0ABY7QU30_9FIRM|nr:3-isopropylmalate dehydratase small subunit [Peptoniphilus equinus]WBW49393.1 3-isopropylmalate dehydratase small subunit [Peptoniphilus equinus]
MTKGKVWKYKDNINTDIITPPESMELDIKSAAKYCMANLDPTFADGFQPGDIFVCEHNLGSGSSRETAPLCLKELGVRIVIAMDYARIFYRNCINVGIIVLECPDTDKISKDDMLDVDYLTGIILNETTGQTYHCNPIPTHIAQIIEKGGLINYISDKLRKS